MIVNSRRSMGDYGFIPALAAAVPGIIKMFDGGAEPPPPPPPSVAPYILGGVLGVLVLGGMAYAMVKA